MQESEAALSSSSSQLPAKSPLLLQASSTCSWAWLCYSCLSLLSRSPCLEVSPFASLALCRGAGISQGWHPGQVNLSLSHGASHTGKSAAIHCGGGKRGKKVIYLRWGRLFCCSPVPLCSADTSRAGGVAGLCLRARADAFQRAATQTRTSKGWRACVFLKQLSRFYWAIKYGDEDIKAKL